MSCSGVHGSFKNCPGKHSVRHSATHEQGSLARKCYLHILCQELHHIPRWQKYHCHTWNMGHNWCLLHQCNLRRQRCQVDKNCMGCRWYPGLSRHIRRIDMFDHLDRLNKLNIANERQDYTYSYILEQTGPSLPLQPPDRYVPSGARPPRHPVQATSKLAKNDGSGETYDADNDRHSMQDQCIHTCRR